MRRKHLIAAILLVLAQQTGRAQSSNGVLPQEEAYFRVVSGRADKIVAGMKMGDSLLAKRTSSLIAHQYNNLNNIYTRRDTALAQLKRSVPPGTKPDEKAVAAIQEKTTKSLDSLHVIYLAQLSQKLTREQLEQVKDGMTYGVLPITWAGYQDMIPALTEKQKKQMLDWLTEAREHAMDAESSEKKHAWFGKYKGRINNYLSKEGYDMKKESRDWEERVKARKQNK